MKTLCRQIENRKSKIENPPGFTLLEIILALGLTSLLLGAVYGALQLHWGYSSLGQIEMERAQVARALMRRMETDLRSVLFRKATGGSTGSETGSTGSTSGSTTGSGASSTGTNSSGTATGSTTGSSTSSTSSTGSTASTSGTSSSSTSASGSESTTPTDSNTAFTTQKMGLYGESQVLVVHASLPNRATSGVVETTGTIVASDLQSIGYFLVGSSSTLAQQLSGQIVVPPGMTKTGLARLQGDRMAIDTAEQIGDLTTLGAHVQLLAPEVANILFEFFDGVSWSTTWDTGSSSSVPNAVRVTIDFLPPDTTRLGWFARPVNPSSNTYQHIIALPLAEPYVGTTTP